MNGYVGARKYYWDAQHLAPYSQPFAMRMRVFSTFV